TLRLPPDAGGKVAVHWRPNKGPEVQASLAPDGKLELQAPPEGGVLTLEASAPAVDAPPRVLLGEGRWRPRHRPALTIAKIDPNRSKNAQIRARTATRIAATASVMLTRNGGTNPWRQLTRTVASSDTRTRTISPRFCKKLWWAATRQPANASL